MGVLRAVILPERENVEWLLSEAETRKRKEKMTSAEHLVPRSLHFRGSDPFVLLTNAAGAIWSLRPQPCTARFTDGDCVQP